MKIKELDNSKKKNKLSEATRGKTRPRVFFRQKRSEPELRISKPKISDIETDWDFKPVPIATPPLTPPVHLKPHLAPVQVPSLAHKPLPKFALAPDLVPDWKPSELPDPVSDWKPSELPDPVYDPEVVGGKLPEPEWETPRRPELERPEPGGSKWGADRPGIDTGPKMPPLFPPGHKGKEIAPVFTKPEFSEPTIKTTPVQELPGLGPIEPDLGDRTQLTLPPKEKELEPIENYTDLSDKAKKVFWRVLKGVEDPTAEMLEVHPNEWKEIILKTKADGDQITKFGFDQANSSVQDTSTSNLAPANPEKGVDARDFWEGLGYSSLAQFEKAQKDGSGGKIGYAKGSTTGKQVPVVYPKQAYISKQAIDAGLTIGPKGNLVTSPKTISTGNGDKTTKPEEFNLADLEFAKPQIRQPGEVAGGTPITQTVMPSLSAKTREQMHKQLQAILTGNNTKQQRAVIKDIETNLKDLTPKDKITITNYMTGIIKRNIDPHDPNLYHIGGVDITGKELATYAGATVLGSAALVYLLPATLAGAALAGLTATARLAILNTMNIMRTGAFLKFATQTFK